jgi:antitoxin component of RelBE/YafQ-DinJ toxin-antitoxin module
MLYVQANTDDETLGKEETIMGRLEVRLDRDHRLKLEEIARSHGLTVSEMVRQMIERAYEQELRTKRIKAAEELSELEVEEVPDPAILTGQLEGTHESPRLY